LYAEIIYLIFIINMFYRFIVEIYKIVGMLETYAFKLFPKNFNIFGFLAFIMAGIFTDFNVVVYSFFNFSFVYLL